MSSELTPSPSRVSFHLLWLCTASITCPVVVLEKKTVATPFFVKYRFGSCPLLLAVTAVVEMVLEPLSYRATSTAASLRS